MRDRLTLVVPAFDEAPTIGWTIRSIASAVAPLLDDGRLGAVDLVVADDHSTDATATVALDAGAAAGLAVSVVPVDGPQGLGAAIRTGLAAATGDLVLYTDADLPFDPGEIGRLLRVLDTYDADLLCGYRFDRTGEGPRRAVQSWIYNGMARAVLPVPSRDVNFACKLIRRRLLERADLRLESIGSFVDVELLARAQRADARIVHVGLDYFPRHGTASTLGGVQAIKGIVADYRRIGGPLRRTRRWR
jgi:glycosyltransferase involved in cell wall biosynthesis